MGFDKLADILKKARERYPKFGRRLTEAEAISRWEKAVGPAIAKHARALKVEDEVLWVEVDHPIWKSELHHRKRQILQILNAGAEHTGLGPAKETVTDILFLDPRPGRRS